MTPASVNRTLAIGAMVLGLLAAAVGTRPNARSQQVDIVTVADWIRARSHATLLDLQPPDSASPLRIPTSRPVDGRALDSLAARRGDTLVLVDGGDGRARDAALALREAPATVLWVEDAVTAWARDVLNPTIPEDAPDSAFAAFARMAELSRYFGGLPRIVPPGNSRTSDVTGTVRRGCGF